MKKLILLIVGCIAATTAFPQMAKYATKVPQPDQYWALAKDSITWMETKGQTILHIEATDTSTYVLTVYKRKKKWAPKYDTIKSTVVVENNNAAIVKVNTLEGTKAMVSSGNFTYVKTVGTLASIKYTFTGISIAVMSERFAGHGTITIFIDGTNSGSFNQGSFPLITDFSRGIPSFFKKLSPGQHTIEIQSKDQFLFDAFIVGTYTLKPRP